jgi:hypothetical protein
MEMSALGHTHPIMRLEPLRLYSCALGLLSSASGRMSVLLRAWRECTCATLRWSDVLLAKETSNAAAYLAGSLESYTVHVRAKCVHEARCTRSPHEPAPATTLLATGPAAAQCHARRENKWRMYRTKHFLP